MGGIVGSFDRALGGAVMVRDQERTVGQYGMRGFIVAGRRKKSIPRARFALDHYLPDSGDGVFRAVFALF